MRSEVLIGAKTSNCGPANDIRRTYVYLISWTDIRIPHGFQFFWSSTILSSFLYNAFDSVRKAGRTSASVCNFFWAWRKVSDDDEKKLSVLEILICWHQAEYTEWKHLFFCLKRLTSGRIWTFLGTEKEIRALLLGFWRQLFSNKTKFGEGKLQNCENISFGTHECVCNTTCSKTNKQSARTNFALVFRPCVRACVRVCVCVCVCVCGACSTCTCTSRLQHAVFLFSVGFFITTCFKIVKFVGDSEHFAVDSRWTWSWIPIINLSNADRVAKGTEGRHSSNFLLKKWTFPNHKPCESGDMKNETDEEADWKGK